MLRHPNIRQRQAFASREIVVSSPVSLPKPSSVYCLQSITAKLQRWPDYFSYTIISRVKSLRECCWTSVIFPQQIALCYSPIPEYFSQLHTPLPVVILFCLSITPVSFSVDILLVSKSQFPFFLFSDTWRDGAVGRESVTIQVLRNNFSRHMDKA